jgi:arylsulfatase A-like enzyme
LRARARALDAGVGAVLAALDELGMSERTLVIATTDHGIPFPRAKATLYDAGTAVFLIFSGGAFGGGRATDALASQIDVFPTICDVAGIERPRRLEGRSLLPVARGEAEGVRDEVFVEGTYHAAYEPQRGVRTSRWKYIRRFGERRLPVLANIDDSPSKEAWMRAGYGSRPIDAEQLYDLVLDPIEANNLAEDPSLRDVRDELSGRLERWMTDTRDPLLDGPVAPPPGAEWNDPDQVSAEEPTRTRVG